MTLHASPMRGVLTSLMILVMLGLLLMGLVAYRQGVFEQRVIFALVTDSAQDLYQGMKLTYRGFKLGQIERLSMGPDGRVSVELSVQQDRRFLVTEGTRVRVSKDKLITSELVLEPSSNASSSPLKEGGTIELVREHVAADMARKVDQLLQQMDLLLGALADPAKGLPAVVRQTQATMALAQPVSHQAVQTMTELERLLTSLQPMSVQATQTLGELQQSLVQSRATLEQTHNLMQQLADPESGVAPALQEVRATSDKADRLIQTMDAALQEVQSAPVYRWFVPRQPSSAR